MSKDRQRAAPGRRWWWLPARLAGPRTGTAPTGPRPRWRARLRRWLAAAALLIVLGPPTAVLVYGVVPPPATPLMLIRLTEGAGIDRDWVPIDRISPHLRAAVIAAEDNRFCEHRGFDWSALRDAYDGYRSGGTLRGGSTISMQTAKNAFLWPGRTLLRKGIEAWFTTLIELQWSKRRILEVYLNVAEWGPGIYGAESAARIHFGKAAADLTRREAALLAAVLPNPIRWSASKPTAYISRRANTIARRIDQLGPLLDCAVRV